MPTHIAHICLCLPTHKPTRRQSQKSAIANALFRFVANFRWYLPTFAPMKVFTLIFSFYILALSCMYCSDKDNCKDLSADHLTCNASCDNTHDQNQQDNDNCSPFCQCSCCHGFVVLQFSKFTSEHLFANAKQFALYSANFSSAFSGNIWQPPKIS